ncbi:hypothetical protein JAAARDRAFT_309158 [Jaapia argillacea MUCL 33604]|uniref:F-box domain-containing protein n=1 Tax=Jaapia argillacea MUCL 33604 TaxID=933084 RepID=A0A067PR89_9AGAM|nr:hypothetical protein JAAARDRAFT_309158 [Jaapia argillacea MUCL 33604]
MFQHFPLDIQLEILLYLSLQDILNARATCRSLYSATEHRTVWQYAISAIVGSSIRAHTSLLSNGDLRRETLKVARLQTLWCMEDVEPTSVITLTCPENVKFARIIPGSDWLVVASDNGSLRLRNIRTNQASLSTPSVAPFLEYLTCEVLSSGEDNVVLSTGTDLDGTSHLLLHRVDLTVPSLEVVVSLTFPEKILTATAGLNLILYASTAGEDELVVARSFGGDRPAEQVVMDIDAFTTLEDSTMALLGSHRFFVSNSYGFAIFEMPPMTPVQVIDHHSAISVEPFWFLDCDLLVYPPIISHVDWMHRSPNVMILDYHCLHILSGIPPLHRTISLPTRDDGDVTAIGTRHAAWWNPMVSPPLSAPGVTIRICTFPMIHGGSHLEEASAEEFPVRVGSLLVDEPEDQTPESISLDEWAGRLCILFRGESDSEDKTIMLLDIL